MQTDAAGNSVSSDELVPFPTAAVRRLPAGRTKSVTVSRKSRPSMSGQYSSHWPCGQLSRTMWPPRRHADGIQHHQHKQYTARRGRDHEEIRGHELSHVIRQERAPSLPTVAVDVERRAVRDRPRHAVHTSSATDHFRFLDKATLRESGAAWNHDNPRERVKVYLHSTNPVAC
jgi:hypothetical protein